MSQAPQQQQVQVLQSLPPQQVQQVQHFYLPQQHQQQHHVVYSGHLSGSSTLQNVGPVPGVGLQIQHKGQNVQPIQRTYVLHKQPHHMPVHSNVQILSGNNLSQVPQRQVISAQAPGHMYSSPQVLGSYALSPLPHGYSWASSSYAPQSPFIIRTPQPNIYVQHPPPHMAMHMPMPVHAPPPPSTMATQNYSEVCQETQTITTELIPASQSIPCSSLSSIVSSNAVTSTLPPTQQTHLYSLTDDHNATHQYSQSFVPNQANQSVETLTHNPTNQSMQSAVHNSANQPVNSVTQASIQVMNSDANNTVIQPASHNKMNVSSESLIPNQYLEIPNPNTVQYIETPTSSQTLESTESVTCNQSEQYSESQSHSLSGKSTESQATQSSELLQILVADSVNTTQSLNIPSENFMEVEESPEVSNECVSKEQCADPLPHHIQEQPVHEPIASKNGEISSSVSTNGNVPCSVSDNKNISSSVSENKNVSSSVSVNEKISSPVSVNEKVSSPVGSSSPSSTTNCNTFRDNIEFPEELPLYKVLPNDDTDEGSGGSKNPVIKLQRLKLDKQLALVKPLMPVPDSTENAKPEKLKSTPSSPESLPLKKRKHYPIDDGDVPVLTPKYPLPIPPITDLLTPSHKKKKRGRGRPRKSNATKIVKSKKSAKPKSPVRSQTPSPDRATTPVSLKKEAPDEQSSQETRRSKRKQVEIEVIEIIDDDDPIKMEVESPEKSSDGDDSNKTSFSFSKDNSNFGTNDIKGALTSSSSNLQGNLKASDSEDKALVEKNSSTANGGDLERKFDSPSTSKASSFVLEDYKWKDISVMTVQQVSDFINGFCGCSDDGEIFKSNEIDGQALDLLNLEHLMGQFHMKLGRALKLLSHLTNLKEECKK